MSIGEPTEKEYEKIANHIAKGECVLFLGAGISASPQATELAKFLLQKIDENDVRNYLKSEDSLNLSKVANLFEMIHNKITLDQEIKDRLKSPITHPLRFYELVGRLPFKIIITTNYDTLLEDQLRTDNISHKTIVNDTDIAGWNEQEVMILKIHGCIIRSPKLVVSENDYIGYISKPPLIHEILKFLLATKRFLFVGYSLSDFNIKIALNIIDTALQGRSKRHYLIQQEDFSPNIYSAFRNKDIELLKIDGSEFLEKLIESHKKVENTERIADKIDSYLEHYRFDVIKVFKRRVRRKFTKDIVDGRASDVDYEYKDQIVEAFSKEEDQEELIEIIKKGQHVEAVLTVLNQINIDSVSEKIITKLNDNLVKTDNKSQKMSVLKYLHKNKKVNKEILPTLEKWKSEDTEDTEWQRLLSDGMRETFNP